MFCWVFNRNTMEEILNRLDLFFQQEAIEIKVLINQSIIDRNNIRRI